MENVNFLKNKLLYLNQAYLTVKKNNRIVHFDYFTLGQIVEASTPPQDMCTYMLKENE